LRWQVITALALAGIEATLVVATALGTGLDGSAPGDVLVPLTIGWAILVITVLVRLGSVGVPLLVIVAPFADALSDGGMSPTETLGYVVVVIAAWLFLAGPLRRQRADIWANRPLSALDLILRSLATAAIALAASALLDISRDPAILSGYGIVLTSGFLAGLLPAVLRRTPSWPARSAARSMVVAIALGALVAVAILARNPTAVIPVYLLVLALPAVSFYGRLPVGMVAATSIIVSMAIVEWLSADVSYGPALQGGVLAIAMVSLFLGATGERIRAVTIERQTSADQLAQLASGVPACLTTFLVEPSDEPGESVGRVVVVSAMVEQLFGYSADEWMADPLLWEEGIHPDDRDSVMALSRSMLERPDGHELEYRMRHRDGRMIWVREITSAAHRGPGGQHLRYIVAYDITAEKRAETERDALVERLRDFVAATPLAVISIGRRGRLTGLNRSGKEIAALLPDTSGRWRGDVARPLDGEEIVVQTSDGERYLRLWAAPIAQGGRVGRDVIAVVQDETRTRSDERRVADAERRYRELVEQVPATLYAVKRDARRRYSLTYISPRVSDLLHLPPEQVTLHRWIGRIVAQDRKEMLAERLAAMTNGQPSRLEYRIVDADGRTTWVRDEMAAIRTSSDGVSTWQGTLSDISEVKAALMELRDSEERYRTMVAGLVEAIVLFDASGRIIDSNPSAERIFGVPAEKLLGHAIGEGSDYVAESGEPFPVEHHPVFVALATGEAVSQVVFGVHIPSERWFSVSARPLSSNPDAMPDTVVASYADVTERRKLEQNFVQAQKMDAVARLAGGVGHGVGNMLLVINSYAEMLRRRSPDDPSVERDIEGILSAVDRAGRMISQLLSFARHDGLRTEVVDLNHVVEESRPLVERALGARVTIDLDLASVDLIVRISAVGLTQVLMNLGSNASDAISGDGRLRIRTRSEEGDAGSQWAIVEVSDDGSGMDAETMRRAFEPFFTTKSAERGAGLGLGATQSIIAAAGGTMGITSRLGAGTLVTIRLPRILDEQPAAYPTTDHANAGGDEIILLVEDESMAREAVAKMLRARGYRVLAAATAAAAIDLGGSEFDLLLTDVELPGLSGPDVAGRLIISHPDLCVVFLSGYPSDRGLREALDILGDRGAYASKPVRPAELMAIIRRLLDRSAAAKDGLDGTEHPSV
jgi:PAS domain S-box-containing protein